MIKNVERNYLEIYSIKELNDDEKKPIDFSLNLLDPKDFQLNKFFYKNVGKNHQWVDRLIWTDKQWTEYVYNKDVQTYVLKKKSDLAGYFELIMHRDKNEIEISYIALLEEYLNQKLGSFLLSEAIKSSFLIKVKRVWVHTCSLDHKNALNNYLSRGMKIFKKEKISL